MAQVEVGAERRAILAGRVPGQHEGGEESDEIATTSAERIRDGRGARLAVWNRLFHGVSVRPDELDAGLLCGDPTSADERAAYVTLRACVTLSSSARYAVRCALRVAILYWFANIGERHEEGRKPLDPKRSAFHLEEVIGAGMTWNEAVAAMGRRPLDFSAYLSVLEDLQKEYDACWKIAYPDDPPASIAVLAGAIGDAPFSKQWMTAGSADAPPPSSSGPGEIVAPG